MKPEQRRHGRRAVLRARALVRQWHPLPGSHDQAAAGAQRQRAEALADLGCCQLMALHMCMSVSACIMTYWPNCSSAWEGL